MTIKLHHPKTLAEAINDFQVFLESDIYSKFRPECKIKNKRIGYRKDYFRNEKEFLKYIKIHFDVFREEINKANSLKSVVKLMEMAKEAGIKQERERIKKLFEKSKIEKTINSLGEILR